jgi:RimJ/RimL family protein N-acetyltransferase
MDPVELSNGQVLLRLPHETDIDAITRACQDGELQRWIPVPVPYEREHAAQWVGDTLRSWAADEELRWVVSDASGEELLGAVGLHARDASMREIGFWTAPWARGRGVMTAAAHLACDWGFTELKLGRIEWWANVGNFASRRVIEKLGFTVEGTCRSRILHRGERVDGWVGGLLPGELRTVA